MPFVTLSNANPNFYRSIEAEPPGARYKERTVIYSTLDSEADSLRIGQIAGAEVDLHEISAERNVLIYALDLTLYGKISIPGGHIRIFCKVLRIPAGKDDEAGATLDVSEVRDPGFTEPFASLPLTSGTTPPSHGADGDDIAKNHKPFATDGAMGGTIEVFCDELHLGGRFDLRAFGAQGYPGCNGQDGSPAEGGHLPGPGGKAGKGGRGGAGGRINVRYRVNTNTERLNSEAGPGDAGEWGQPGRLGGMANRQTGAAADPVLPADGGDAADQVIDLTTLGQCFDETFLVKVAQRVKQLYLFNQPERYAGDETDFPPAWEDLGELVLWLIAVLDGRKDNARMLELLDTSKELKRKHKNKKTFFGWDASWVPSNKLEDMLRLYERSAKARSSLEARYHKLASGYDDAADAQRELNQARADLGETREVHLAQFEAIRDALKEQLGRISDAVKASESARTALKGPLKDLMTAVENYFQFDLASLLHAAEMIAFTVGGDSAQGLAMAGVEIATLVNDGLSKIKTDDGGDVTKSRVVAQIQSVGKSIADATHGELFELDEDGKPRIDAKHQGALAELTKFQDDVVNLRQSIGKATVDPVVTALEAFVVAATVKGEAIVTYHLFTRRMLDAYARFDEARTKLAELAKRTSPLDPASAGTVSYFARLYQDQLEAAMAEYAVLRRKYAYVTLGAPLNALAAATRGLWIDGSAPQTPELNTLDTSVNDMRRELSAWAGDQPGTCAPFPGVANSRSDLKVHIGPGPLLDSFRETGTLTFTTVFGSAMIPLEGSATDGPSLPVSDSELYYDIRVTHFQPRIIGATTDSDDLTIKIRMTTWSQIYGPDGSAFTFSHHNPRVFSLTHKCSTPASDDPISPHSGDDTDLVAGTQGEVSDGYLDAVGAFTTWTIWVPETVGAESTNAGLDRSGVTGIFIHFKGSRRTLG